MWLHQKRRINSRVCARTFSLYRQCRASNSVSPQASSRSRCLLCTRTAIPSKSSGTEARKRSSSGEAWFGERRKVLRLARNRRRLRRHRLQVCVSLVLFSSFPVLKRSKLLLLLSLRRPRKRRAASLHLRRKRQVRLRRSRLVPLPLPLPSQVTAHLRCDQACLMRRTPPSRQQHPPGISLITRAHMRMHTLRQAPCRTGRLMLRMAWHRLGPCPMVLRSRRITRTFTHTSHSKLLQTIMWGCTRR